MKKIVLILFYIIGFTIVSLLIFQVPHIVSGHHLFFLWKDLIFSIAAGISCGLIVRFFNIHNNKGEE